MSLAPILTVDVEEWFHVCGHPAYADPATWATRVKRAHVGVDALLSLLDGTGSKATFFVLGWVARQSPALVRRIAAAGHEVGCHGDQHRRVVEMSLEEFREDVRRARGTLEEILGSPVTAYRAPEWSMRSATNPALGVLVEEGFTLDSSLVAAPPAGDAGNPDRPTHLATPAGPILEVPPLSGTFFGRRAILGGGVCSRLSREARVLQTIRESLERGDPPVLYCHPWELDPEHPEMDLSGVDWLVHFGGRSRTGKRLARLLALYRFRPVSAAAEVASVGPPRAENAAA